MAEMKSIREEFEALSEAVIELQTFAQVSLELAGMEERAPQWPALVTWHASRLGKASEALEMTLRRKVFPVMDDMAKIRLS